MPDDTIAFAKQLENELNDALLEISGYKETLDNQREQIAELKKDKERLDWLVQGDKICDWIFGRNFQGSYFITEPHVKIHCLNQPNIRTAIDTAMRKENE